MMLPTRSASPPARRRASRWRAHGVATTVLVILLAALVVRDIFVRRWSSPAPPSPDVTQRSL